jgi:hypothetical protein
VEPVEAANIPPDATILNSFLLLKAKINELGEVEKLKARCVIDGSAQQPRDYSVTFAPVGTFTALRVLLALAAVFGLHLRQFDITGAFMYAPLEETHIYMRPPRNIPLRPGMTSSMLYHVKKSLYGLKQAPARWHMQIEEFLLKFGFERSKVDRCLFVFWIGTGPDRVLMCIVLVYVDDAAVAVKSLEWYDAFLKAVDGVLLGHDLEGLGTRHKPAALLLEPPHPHCRRARVEVPGRLEFAVHHLEHQPLPRHLTRANT